MFQVASIIQNLRTLADGTWRLQIDCQELTPEQATELMKLHKKVGWLLFKENHITPDDVPDTDVEFKSDKKPSQRLRNALYVFWAEHTNKQTPFQQFYETWIDKKIEEIKDHL